MTTIFQSRKAKLVEALRSGEYDQCGGQLFKVSEDGESFCCLGVAQRVAEKEFTPQEPTFEGQALPYSEITDWFGFAETSGLTSITDGHGGLVALTTLNDTFGYTFAEIADLIEEGVVLDRSTYDALKQGQGTYGLLDLLDNDVAPYINYHSVD